MRKKTDLTIKFFNEFSISSPYYEYVPSAKNSTQLSLLISYLIANTDSKVPKTTLISVLWPEAQEKDLVGALRNLVYRARRELQNLYPNKDIDYIKFTQDAYYWNPDMVCKLDTLDFENAYDAATKESNPDKQYKYYSRMYKLYTGEFMTAQASVDWIANRRNYYQNLYLSATVNMCQYLYNKGSYDQLSILCDQIILLHPDKLNYYRFKIRAYIASGNLKTALECYRETIEFFSSKYGVDISESMEDLYQEILMQLPSEKKSLKELEEQLGQDDESQGTFYCSYDIFKSFYKLRQRSRQRVKQDSYLYLLTLYSRHNEREDSQPFADAMDLLFDILSEQLRKNDIFTRTSLVQYSLMLVITDPCYIDLVTNRIVSVFNEKNTNDDIIMNIECKKIE